MPRIGSVEDRINLPMNQTRPQPGPFLADVEWPFFCSLDGHAVGVYRRRRLEKNGLKRELLSRKPLVMLGDGQTKIQSLYREQYSSLLLRTNQTRRVIPTTNRFQNQVRPMLTRLKSRNRTLR